jgi:hypothetical protein
MGWGARPALPELRLVQHVRQQTIGALHGAQQTGQEPIQPRCHIQRAALGGLQLVVILFAFALYLGAETVEALGYAFGAGVLCGGYSDCVDAGDGR